MKIGNLSPVLYLRSHVFGSTVAAVKLAEKVSSEKNITFADNLLSIKKSSENKKLNQMVIYENGKIPRKERLAALIARIESVKKNQRGEEVAAPPAAYRPASGQKAHALKNGAPPALPPKKTALQPAIIKEQQRAQYDRLNARTGDIPGDNWVKEKSGRFRDILTALRTQISTSTGKTTAANQLSVGNDDVAIRCQYPKTEHMETYLQMLLDQKPAVLVVLSSNQDINDRQLPPYFRQRGEYGEMAVTCGVRKGNAVTQLNELELNNYRMTIKKRAEAFAIPVIHVTNWEDRTPVSVATLKELVTTINRKIIKKTQENSAYANQPVIHCNAGVGRTGVVAAARQLLKPSNQYSTEDIVLALREKGSPKMVQTAEQYATLLELEAQLKRAR